MKYLVFIIGSCAFHQSCVSGEKNFTAHPSKQRVISNGINVDGCYIGVYKHPLDSSEEIGAFMLYTNGIALMYDPIAMNQDSINNQTWLKKKIRNIIEFQDSFFGRKQAGGYLIEGNNIQIQLFLYVPYGANSLCTFTGRIVDDHTIRINSCSSDDKEGYKNCRSNFILRLIKMEKPDSTNQLMNKNWYWN